MVIIWDADGNEEDVIVSSFMSCLFDYILVFCLLYSVHSMLHGFYVVLFCLLNLGF